MATQRSILSTALCASTIALLSACGDGSKSPAATDPVPDGGPGPGADAGMDSGQDPAIDPCSAPDALARQVLPATDGWAADGAGTTGGSAATSENIRTVTNRAELVQALGGDNTTNGTSTTPTIICVKGTIDLSVDDNNKPLGEAEYADPEYTFDEYLKAYDPATWGAKPVSGPLEEARVRSQANQARQVVVYVGSNKTIAGLGKDAKIIHGNLRVKDVDNVIVRNIELQDSYDLFPQWDPLDGSNGNWNSEYDNMTIEGSTHVWVDRCTFHDGDHPDKTAGEYFANLLQHHDGALDITLGASFITVSYNHFHDHDKTHLVGNSDALTTDEGRLKVTFHHNYYENVMQRLPRLRFGEVHMYNNYFNARFTYEPYPFAYAFGVGVSAKLYSESNYFDLDQGFDPAKIIKVYKGTAMFDAGSYFNGAPIELVKTFNEANPGAPLSEDVGWEPSLVGEKHEAAEVPEVVKANAGAGKL